MTIVAEQSTIVFSISFVDEAGSPVTPTSASWTLTDMAGNVVNERDGVEIASPQSSEDIVLSGGDLSLDGYVGVSRYLVIEATYDSDAGSGLPLKEEFAFEVQNLVAL